MSEIEKLALCFRRFPGIGTRQAKRFVYFLLSSNPQFLEGLVIRIQALQRNISQCADCRRYFSSGEESASGRENSSRDDAPQCVFCTEKVADSGKLLVVEKDVDLENIRKSGAYQGRYFVLGSLIPLTEIKNAEVSPRLAELLRLTENNAVKGRLEEIVIAISATPEGDHTALELQMMLEPLQKKHGFKVSVLGRGLSTGSELEYADSETLKSALENRRS